MWKLKEMLPDNIYVFKKFNGTSCFEYCSVFEDENGVICYVPDSMYQEFIQKFDVDLGADSE